MAQLPPPPLSVPDMSTTWPSPPFSIHHRLPLPPPPPPHQPSWLDEFIEFSTLRRGAHRRSASDSIAFLEAAGISRDQDNDGRGFDGFDDEQLLSMFSDDCSAPPPTTLLASSPSTPNSDHNSNSEDRARPQLTKTEAAEVDSDTEAPYSDRAVTDPKRVKRILANRQSAQRSRVRKLQYISELERSVSTLQTKVSVLSPRVAFFDHQRLILNVDNSALKQRIAALAQDKIFKDAHQEALKKEIERLRNVYENQRK